MGGRPDTYPYTVHPHGSSPSAAAVHRTSRRAVSIEARAHPQATAHAGPDRAPSDCHSAHHAAAHGGHPVLDQFGHLTRVLPWPSAAIPWPKPCMRPCPTPKGCPVAVPTARLMPNIAATPAVNLNDRFIGFCGGYCSCFGGNSAIGSKHPRHILQSEPVRSIHGC